MIAAAGVGIVGTTIPFNVVVVLIVIAVAMSGTAGVVVMAVIAAGRDRGQFTPSERLDDAEQLRALKADAGRRARGTRKRLRLAR